MSHERTKITDEEQERAYQESAQFFRDRARRIESKSDAKWRFSLGVALAALYVSVGIALISSGAGVGIFVGAVTLSIVIFGLAPIIARAYKKLNSKTQ